MLAPLRQVSDFGLLWMSIPFNCTRVQTHLKVTVCWCIVILHMSPCFYHVTAVHMFHLHQVRGKFRFIHCDEKLMIRWVIVRRLLAFHINNKRYQKYWSFQTNDLVSHNKNKKLPRNNYWVSKNKTKQNIDLVIDNNKVVSQKNLKPYQNNGALCQR